MEKKNNFCGKCGARLSENAQFCPNCGNPIEQKKLPLEAERITEAKQVSSTEKKSTPIKKNRRKIKLRFILICMIVILGIIIILFSIGFISGNSNGTDVSKALLGREFMSDFIKQNNFAKMSDFYYVSKDGGVTVELDENGVPKNVMISNGNITLFDIQCGDQFLFETVGKKLTSNGYMYYDSNEDSITYIAEFPNGHKEIKMLLNGESEEINSIIYSVYIMEESEETREEKVKEEVNIIKKETAQNDTDKMEEGLSDTEKKDLYMINHIFPGKQDTIVSWYSSKTGYYMIPCPKTEEKYFVLFSCENSNAKAAQEYYVEVTDISSTENGGIACKGPLYSLFEPGADATAVVQIVWESPESIDFPTISVCDGNQFTDTSVIADDYDYAGPIENYGYYIPVWKEDYEYSTDNWDLNTPYYSDAGDTMNEPHIMIVDSSTREITDDEIYWMTPEQLQIAINEIYARHGRKFKDSHLQEWFDAQLWYQGNIKPEDFNDSMLSQIEKDNIAVLQHRKQVNEM